MESVKRAPRGKKRRNLRYFYFEGKLHKVLRISYPQNLVEAWCFPDGHTVAILYTDYRRNAKKSIKTSEVAELMNISRRSINDVLGKQEIRGPQIAYAIGGDPNRWWRCWGEEHVLELHEAFMQRHRGRPRKDGKITPNPKIPTAAQIKAFFRNEETLYIQAEDGRMVPVFEPQRW